MCDTIKIMETKVDFHISLSSIYSLGDPHEIPASIRKHMFYDESKSLETSHLHLRIDCDIDFNSDCWESNDVF